MANILVCCGGTGAHAGLAFMRLHALGHPLGFFRQQNGDGQASKPLELPSIYLVDQDDGDGDHGETAWQALRRVIENHPSRSEWGDTSGKQAAPRGRVLTPLPVGPNKEWIKKGHDRLLSRFEGMDYLGCMTSPSQAEIQFSHGMMGSPAVGSLLFRMKTCDLDSDGINNDAEYENLRRQRGRFAVVGSAVGGTGSSVGPTLAQILAGLPDSDVMAVMVLDWFKLNEDPNQFDAGTVKRAQARNRDMMENASSGLQYYGSSLAKTVATVPVGVPEGALVVRDYAGDTMQPLQEAYPHAVAALCCMWQYLDKTPPGPGLYHMGASNPHTFGGGNNIPGGTVQSLANQGDVLAATAQVLARVLETDQEKGSFLPEICKVVRKSHGDLKAIGAELAKLGVEYRSHLSWLFGLGTPREARQGLTRESDVRWRLKHAPLSIRPDYRAEEVAGEVFRWIGRWVQDEAAGDSRLGPPARGAKRPYWPPSRKDALNVSAGEAGKLTKLPAEKESAILQGFVDPGKISQNGWPDAFATASYFHDAIDRRDQTALRKLELLMVGLVDGPLSIRPIEDDDRRPISLDIIVEQERRRCGYDSLAEYCLVGRQNGAGTEHVFGFSSPYTLFCAAPGVSDKKWGLLWQDLTGSKADDWRESDDWGSSDLAVRKIVSWVKACRLRNRDETPPVWTRMFHRVKVPPGVRASFGAGARLELDWAEEAVTEFLPTMESGDFRPGDIELPKGSEADFLEEHGQVRDDSGRMVFEEFTFRIPGRDAEHEVQGIWKGHLEHLQAQGDIVTFGSDREAREVYVVTHHPGSPRECIVLPNTRLLDRESIMVDSIVPMRQDPIPGQSARRDDLYPDLPLRSDYFGLVKSSDEQTVLEQLCRGGTVKGYEPRIHSGRNTSSAVWTLPLLGRADPVNITPTSPPKESFHGAHWMVWPRFRTLKPRPWRAYYVYEHCTDPRLHLDTLYLDPDTDQVLQSRNEAHDRLSYPIRYDARTGVHAGGPPIAFALRDTDSDEERGIYFVTLDELGSLPARVQMGIDFGTSHTVGAVSVGQQRAGQIELEPELQPGSKNALSAHVSQNWDHVTAPAGDVGLLSQSVWVPTYVEDVNENLKCLLPTEILTIEKCNALAHKPVADWVPMLDFVVPPVGISRGDFVDHVVANFKWDTARAFRGHERDLRKIYLDRILELFVAEVFDKYERPDQTIDCTFTYPLRTPSDDVKAYQDTLRDVIERGSKSLGCDLQLVNDEGIFDESHATRVGTKRFGEVCLVGDLGGGTLDLIISSEGRPELEFEEAVDSVKIGGTLLLRTLAEELGPTMPAGWSNAPEERAAQLVAWMRKFGSRRLFGRSRGEVPEIPELGLRGFDTSANAKAGRDLIHRYFHLASEYLARSLAAYLAEHWYPTADEGDWEKLRILVYLRGNGWRLWPESDEYREIEKVIADRVSSRVRKLWKLLPRSGIPGASRKCMPGGGGGHPKLDPVREVVGKPDPTSEVRGDWRSYTTVELRILNETGEESVPWHQRIPFPTRGSGVQLQLEGVTPPIPLTSPRTLGGLKLDGLSEESLRRTNEALNREGFFGGPDQRDFEAPVGALVWEAAFESALLKKGRKD